MGRFRFKPDDGRMLAIAVEKRGGREDEKKLEQMGLMVLTPTQMRSRFTDSKTKQLMGMVEDLMDIDPSKNPRDYKRIVTSYVRISRKE